LIRGLGFVDKRKGKAMDVRNADDLDRDQAEAAQGTTKRFGKTLKKMEDARLFTHP
jgi:hypothetical protein